MTIQEFQSIFTDNNKKLFNESRNKKPSVYFIRTIANELADIVKKLKSDADRQIPELISLEYDLEVFLADLDGNLEKTYKDDYRDRWLNQEKKIKVFENYIIVYMKNNVEI